MSLFDRVVTRTKTANLANVIRERFAEDAPSYRGVVVSPRLIKVNGRLVNANIDDNVSVGSTVFVTNSGTPSAAIYGTGSGSIVSSASNTGNTSTPSGDHAHDINSLSGALNYTSLINRNHNIISEHNVTGAQYSVIGLPSANTLGVMATTSDATSNSNTILRSSASGGLSLNSLSTFTIVTSSGGMTIAPASGVLQVNNILSVGAGSAGAPSLTFTGDTTTGIFRQAAGSIGFSAANAEKMRITTAAGVVALGATTETALGVDNIRFGTVGGTPRIILEDASFTQWEIDNSSGVLRFFNPGTVRVQFNADGSVTSASDTDVISIFGRAKVGLAGSFTDEAAFGHFDRMATGTYTLRATAAGDTYLNASTGRATYFANNNATFMSMSSTALTIENGKIVQTPSFVSGFAGNGFRLDQGISYSGYTHLEIDNLTVRGTMRVYELLVQQIRATNGSIFVTSAAKIVSVVSIGYPSYNLTVDGDNNAIQPFAVNDKIRAQRLQLGSGAVIFRSDCTVIAINVGGNAKTFQVDWDGVSTPPAPSMEFVRLGNSSDTARQGGLYLSSDDSGAPFMDVFNGITAHSDWNTSGKVKLRIGKLTGITGISNEYGLIAGVNGFGVNDSWFKTSTSGFEQRNSNSKWFVSGVEELRIDPTTGIEIRLAANARNAISWHSTIGDGSSIASVGAIDSLVFGRGISVGSVINNQNLLASAMLSATNNYYSDKPTTALYLWNGIIPGGTYFDNVAVLSAKQLRFGYSSIAGGGKIYFTNVWSGFPDGADTSIAEISSDTDIYNGLMLVGNKSQGDGYRHVLFYDIISVGSYQKSMSSLSLTLGENGFTTFASNSYGNSSSILFNAAKIADSNHIYAASQTKYLGGNAGAGSRASMLHYDANASIFQWFMQPTINVASGSTLTNAWTEQMSLGYGGQLTVHGQVAVDGSTATLTFLDRTGTSPASWSWYASGGLARLYNNVAGDIATFSSAGNMVHSGTYQNNKGSIKSYTNDFTQTQQVGGAIYLQSQKPSGVANFDVCGAIQGFAYNSANSDQNYVSAYMQAYNVTAGSEQGAFIIQTKHLGNTASRFSVVGRNFGFNGESFGGGDKVIYIANAITTPTTNPSAGGILYVLSGALMYRGSNGTVTTIAPA